MKSVEELDQLFSDALKRVKSERNNYSHKKHIWRFSTLVAKVVAFAGLFVGIAAPLVPEFANGFLFIEWSSGIQLGYVALALAGAVFAVDRVFMLSNTWVRFATAQIQLETLLAGAQYKWLKFKSTIIDHNVANERQSEAISICERFVMDARTVVEQEVKNGGDQFTAKSPDTPLDNRLSLHGFREHLGEHPENGVMIKLGNHKLLTGAVSVRIGDVSEIRAQPTQTIVFDNVIAGQHKLIISSTLAKDEEKEFRWEDIILVRENEANMYELDIARVQD